MGVFTRATGRARPVPYRAHRSITAAASRIDFKDNAEIDRLRQRGSSQWQQEAWEYYDAIGEIKYAMNLVGNVCSRVRLFAAMETDADQAPSAIDDIEGLPQNMANIANRQMRRLASAHGGQAGLIRDYAINVQVAGECYLVQQPGVPALGKPEEWDVKSVDEITIDASGRATIRDSSMRSRGGVAGRQLPENAFVARIWRTHPRYTDDADSSLRGILELCSELLLLSRMVRGVARSRLNAGALYLPDGLSVAGAEDGVDPMITPTGVDTVMPVSAPLVDDAFEDALVDAMTAPIQDEESAASVVPLLIRGPAELGDKIKQFKFERSFDEQLAQRSDRVLERILQGLDVPKDVVTGLANVKYSNAIRIDESLYKAHIEPLMLMLCDALTVTYLRPALIAAGYSREEASRVLVWYDPSEITTRPDKAQDADIGHDRFLISNEAWRRAHSFTESDAPSPEEVAIRLMIQRGALAPEVTEALLERMYPGITDLVRGQALAENPSPPSEGLQQILQGEPVPEGGTGPSGPGGRNEVTPPIPPTDTPPSEPVVNSPLPGIPVPPGGV